MRKAASRTSRAGLARGKARGPGSRHRWSQRVTETSRALQLEPGVFRLEDPREIAASLRRSAERSKRRKASPHRSAMSMLTFYLNRGGRQLPEDRRLVLERANDELRKLYGRL